MAILCVHFIVYLSVRGVICIEKNVHGIRARTLSCPLKRTKNCCKTKYEQKIKQTSKRLATTPGLSFPH